LGDTSMSVDELRAENESLRRAIFLLHRIAGLVESAVQFEHTCYALLTGVTAGVGLGLNRAMLFLVDPGDRSILKGSAAVGPEDGGEAERVWGEIEASAPDLEALFEAGLRQLESPGRLDRAVRATRVDTPGDSPVALALRRGMTVTRTGSDDLGGLLHLPTSICAPLRGRRAIHGVLYGDSCFTGESLDPARELVFGLLAANAGRAMESAMAYEQAAREAKTDSLTGLGNHGSLMSDMGAAARAALESGRAVALVMLDLDDFKNINDTLGHLAGDALLAEVSRRIGRILRHGDRAYRYGGDEFAVLLEETDGEEGLSIAERIVEEISTRPFDVGGNGHVCCTCSAGVASMPPEADGATLVAAADSALLGAKGEGKHRVRLSGRSLL